MLHSSSRVLGSIRGIGFSAATGDELTDLGEDFPAKTCDRLKDFVGDFLAKTGDGLKDLIMLCDKGLFLSLLFSLSSSNLKL